jgi:DNA-binding PadR family transcriptional regulator
MPEPRLSQHRLEVLASFLQQPERELSGADVMRLTDFASGTLYPVLYALEHGKLLKSRWETEDPSAMGRPRRRLYRVTALGEHVAREAIAKLNRRITRIPVQGEQ